MKRVDIKTAVIHEITKKTARDKQRRVGPSDLGGCPRCLAEKMLGEGDGFGDDFSLYPWIGTAVHHYLEYSTFPGAQHELRVSVGEIPGYGEIKGTTDLLLPWDDGATVLDWKIVALKRIRDFRVNGVSKQYRYQVQMYGKGAVNEGFNVDSVAICFIPRDSQNVNEIWVHEEAYQPEMVDRVMLRAEKIYQQALAKGVDSIPSDDDCYTCNRRW